MQHLQGKRILLGISGGIALYKSLDLLSRLHKAGAECRVIMTKGAEAFIQPLSFQTLSHHRVYDDLFAEEDHFIPHIDLSRWADLFIIAPATANILAKIVQGISDDLLSAAALASHCPLVVAPSMNVVMYENPATQKNLALLKERGIGVIEPEAGFLACEEEGKGRMPEAEDLVEVICCALTPKDLAGKKLLISGGPTRESLDPVRFLTNHSSGKQGVALAKMAHWRGAEVCFLHGPLEVNPPKGVSLVPVESTEDLFNEVDRRFDACDALIMAAAPCDLRPETRASQKIKKREQADALTLSMTFTPDILKTMGQRKTHQCLIGFAAETQELARYAKEKLIEKNLDYIVANDVTAPGAGFGLDTNVVSIFSKTDQTRYPLGSKEEVANHILDLLR